MDLWKLVQSEGSDAELNDNGNNSSIESRLYLACIEGKREGRVFLFDRPSFLFIHLST